MHKKCKNAILRILAILLFSLILSSCMGKYMPPPQTISKTLVIPKIGKVVSCGLGETMIKTGKGHYSDGIIVHSTVAVLPLVYQGKIIIKKGFYSLIFEDDLYKYYYPSEDGQITDTFTKGVMHELRISKNNEIVVVNQYQRIWQSKDLSNLNYEEVKSQFVLQEDSFQQTMIYLGKMDNIVRFSYREFLKNSIRASFTTEISYDLSESNIIGYKNFKAEIIEATNTNIKYKVISSF